MSGFGSYNSNIAQNTLYNPAEPELQQTQKVSQPSLLSPIPLKPQAFYDPNNSQTTQQSGLNAPSLPPSQADLSYENTYQPGSQSSGWNDPPISKTNKPQVRFLKHFIYNFNY